MDVELVHPDLRALGLEVFGEAERKFQVFACVTDKSGGWVNGQVILPARLLFLEAFGQRRPNAGPPTRLKL